ncbi:MAG: chromosome segregation protein SMC, partial [Promethearchaeota archaeon]
EMVFIKQMICTGFKSFRKRTVVNFDKGFTAIVGANGSGKSNVIDAFVFVLGALSAKTLRAKNIKDLISNGGHGLGPSQTASVELVFDNSDSSFASLAEEVRILRKIDRKGNGIYKLNGKKSTRKNITNLLDLTGVLPNSSNMIMQGKLFELIGMNVNERRELIEEIAGISSYNVRKESAEGELLKVQTDLGQISLLLNEVRDQMDQLQKEKEEAERFIAIVEQEKIRNNALYKVKQKNARNKISEYNQKKEEIDQKIANLHQIEKETQEKIVIIQKEITDLEPQIEKLQDKELLKMTYQIKELKDTITELRTSLKYSQKNLISLQTEQKDLHERLSHIDQEEDRLKIEIAGIEKQKEENQVLINQKTQEVTEIDQQLIQIDSQYVQIKERIKELRKEISEVKDKKNQKETKIKVIEQEIGGLVKNKDKLEQRIFSNHETLGNLKIELGTLKEEKKNKLGLGDLIDISKAGMESRIKQLESEIKQFQGSLKQIKPQALQVQKELYELNSKIRVVKQMNSGSRAISAILKLRNSGKIQGIYGTIAELGSADPKYAAAFEMAAGSRFNFIVVDNQLIAQKCIQYLRQNKLGRASFIPLDEIRYSPYTGTLPQSPKIFGRAVDLIQFEQKYYHAFEFVFGRTIIVEDLNTARELQIPAKRVTLEGDVVEGSNLMTGGAKNKLRGIGFKGVNQDQTRLSELEIMDKSYQSKIANLEQQIKSNTNEISRLYNLKLSSTNKTKEISENIAICKSKIEHVTESIHTDESEIEDILHQIEKLQIQKQGLDEGLAELESQLQVLVKEEQELQSTLDSSAESELRTRLRNVEKKMNELKSQGNTIEIELTKKLTTLNETLRNGRKEAQTQLTQKSQSITEISASITSISEDLHKNELEEADLDQKITLKSTALAKLMNQKKALVENLSNQKTKLGQLNTDLYPLQLDLNNITLKSEEYENKIQEWACNILPDIDVPVEFLNVTEQTHQNKLNQLAAEKMAIGPVNLRAIDKYADISVRYSDLEKKNEQVIQEREAIIDFIMALESEKKKVFLNTFNAINTNFGYIFGKLSPGGEAKLELLNPEEPFDDGIEIMARPGEKEKCNVMALSGGERTLTIIALILGIQMHVPSPYYILDEIDAALDDVNAALVADIIKELSEKSQFIIITHRDVTMA